MFYLSLKLLNMQSLKKETRGRKKLPASKKKVAIRIMVPGKFKFRAQAECNLVEAKYSA